MAKKDFRDEKQEMSLEEARAFRASLFKQEAPKLAEHEKREEFRKFWANNRNKYNKSKELEKVLWVHLQSAGFDEPSKFEEGLKNFGLKKVR